LAPLSGIELFILGFYDLTYLLRTNNSLNLHWLACVILFQVATPLNKSIKYTAGSNPCWLLEILGREAFTDSQSLFPNLINLTFVSLLIFALFDALVLSEVNLVIWRFHF